MKQLPTLTLTNNVVSHGEFYVSNGRLFKFNAITQRGEMVLVIDEYIASKEVTA